MLRLRSRHYYALFTASFFLLWFLFKIGGTTNAIAALRSTAIDMGIDYTALIVTVEFLLPKYFYKARYLRFALTFMAIVLTGGSANIVLQLWLIHTNIFQYTSNLARYKEHFYYWFWSDLVVGSYFMITLMCLAGAAIRLAFDRVHTAKKMAELEAANLSSELENLKNQLNPHFLFNALNTIYYRIDKNNAAARALTLQFSTLLRYQLYECNRPEVHIEKELEFIENYIELQKHRAGDGLTVTTEGLRSLAGFTLPPHLLMPLVENCFKHVSHFPDKPNHIEISCRKCDNKLHFHTSNTIGPAAPSATIAPSAADPTAPNHPGIGLSAIRKQLSLLGPEEYKLKTTQTASRFETTLTIPLT